MCNDCSKKYDNQQKDCECKEPKKLNISILLDILIILVIFWGYVTIRSSYNLKVRLNDAIQENIELKKMISASTEIDDIQNMDVSKGMDFEKIVEFRELYSQYFNISHLENYSIKVRNEEIVVSKLKEALKHEKSNENKSVIEQLLKSHEEYLNSYKEQYEKCK